jgi:hypothetical protein
MNFLATKLHSSERYRGREVAAIDTPYTQHAKNLMPVEPQNPPPVYAPETVAQAILYCAEHAERDVYIGGGGKALAVLGRYAPRLTDKLMEAMMFDMQQFVRPAPYNRVDSLYTPSADGRERGEYSGHVAEASVYTKASLHPLIAGSVVAGLGVVALAGCRSLRQ